jgi:dTDP-glucose pyrophosphorylase
MRASTTSASSSADTAEQIREAVGRGGRWGVNITYIPQEKPLGLAHAVKVSQPFLGDERFVMFLGDNVIQGGISTLIRQFASSAWNSQIVLTPSSIRSSTASPSWTTTAASSAWSRSQA